MISAEEALAAILARALPLGAETVSIGESLHRHLAAALTAPMDLPPFDNSAMDGFAVRSADTRNASETEPVRFRVLRTIAAGDRQTRCLPPVAPGQAVRIMTGAPMPEGADAVVPFEDASADGDDCLIPCPADAGDNVRSAGEDVSKGASLFERGERITPRTIALLAALGMENVEAFRRPRVLVLSTGSELVPAGTPLQPGQIYNSNGPAVAAALREMGIEARVLDSAVDKEEALARALRDAEGDVLITIGGVSAGDFDLVPKVMKDLGAEIVFHKVAIKPGKPLLYAVRVGAGSPRPGAETAPLHIFGLPGNPVSALMVFDRFVRPALLKMMGAGKIARASHEAVAAEALKGAEGKEVYLRGIVTADGGRFVARSAGPQGSAMLGSLARANAILVVPAGKSRIAPGETLSFEFLEAP